MEREVEIGERKYKIVIGFGAYHRVRMLTGIAIMDRPEMRENVPELEGGPTNDWEETSSESAQDAKEAEDTLNATLRSEGLLEKKERVRNPDTVEGDIFEMIQLQEQLASKSVLAKLKILELTVRDENRKKLSSEYFEEGLDPQDGEELFGLVMETMEELTSEIENKETAKNS